jgi:hypothetical protein
MITDILVIVIALLALLISAAKFGLAVAQFIIDAKEKK